MITTDEIMQRAVTVWPLRTVDYDQRCGTGPADPDGRPRRADCSEYVAMCWDLDGCTWSTVNLVNVMTEVPLAELRPGDAIGLCGPGTAGDAGHIMLVATYDPVSRRITGYEQRGGPPGPTPFDRVGLPKGYRAYRYNESEAYPVDVMRSSNPEQGDIDAWRLDALAYGLDTVRGGPMAGEAMWIVQAIKALTPTSGDHVHSLPGGQTGPAE